MSGNIRKLAPDSLCKVGVGYEGDVTPSLVSGAGLGEVEDPVNWAAAATTTAQAHVQELVKSSRCVRI
jgi:hypothetical protein